MSQYFENDKTIKSEPKTVTCWCGEHLLKLQTDHGVFSYGEIDDASLKLLKYCDGLRGKVLDLGCGYGFIGIYLKKKYPNIDLYQSDINERALNLCKMNCATNEITSTVVYSDAFSNLNITFDNIILNPPVHAGKEICYKLIDESINNLNKDGSLYIVIRKKHGADSYIKYCKDREYDFLILDKKDGIYVISLRKGRHQSEY